MVKEDLGDIYKVRLGFGDKPKGQNSLYVEQV